MKNMLMKFWVVFWLLGFYTLQTNQAQVMYDNLWKKVSDAESKGLPETARKSVEEIYKQAQKDKNNAQLVKAVIYRLKYYEIKEEKDLMKAIMQVASEAEKATMPTKNLLYSMLAEIYWKYYQENRWRFQGRTKMTENSEDIETWTTDKIVEEVSKNYLLSLENAQELQKIQIQVFDEVISEGSQDARRLRPTMYDFLAWRAVEFFQNTEPDITRPAYYFQMDKVEFLAETETFAKLNLQTKDEDSFKFKALKIYQDLLRLNANNPDVLLHTDLARLQFVHSQSVLPQKNGLW